MADRRCLPRALQRGHEDPPTRDTAAHPQGSEDRLHGRIRRLWTARALAWFPDGPDSSALALLKFVPDSADYWDAPKGRMQRAFGAMAAALTGRPVDQGEPGEHGVHAGLSTPERAASGA